MNIAVKRKDIDSILAQPLTPVRMLLAQKLVAKKLTEPERDTLVLVIRKTLLTNAVGAFDKETKKIAEAMQSGILTVAPNLGTPELQLLWAAHLTQAVSAGLSIQSKPLWKQLLACDFSRYELMRHAAHIARDKFNSKTRLVWGVPGSMFYFEPTKNNINIDFVMSLIGGFEDTRSIIFHEIGHSKLTRKFSDKMLEIRDAMIGLDAKGKSGTLQPAEYAELYKLSVQWEHIFRLYDEAENSPVNRYSINAGKRIQQDMGASLNAVEVVIADAASNVLPTDQTAQALFSNLKRAIRLSLYKNNDLFDDDEAGWQRMGIRRDWIKAAKTTTTQAFPADDFHELMELCGGSKGLEQLQPGTLDRMKGAAWLEAITEQKAAERNKIIDDIWMRYALPLLQPLIAEAESQAMQNIQQALQQQQQGQSQEQGHGQGQGQGQSQGQGQPGQSQPGTGRGTGAKDSGENSVDVDQAGKLPGVKMPPKTPEEAAEEVHAEAAKNQEANQGNDPGERKSEEETEDNGQDTPNGEGEGQSIDSLLQEMDNADQSVSSSSGQPRQTIDVYPQSLISLSQKGGRSKMRGSQVKLGESADYARDVKILTPSILQAQRLIRQIQDRQTQILSRTTDRYELEPEGGDMELFDMERHTDMMTDIASGKRMTEDAARRFRIIKETKKPATIDFVIKIDGSGSMFLKTHHEWNCSPIEAGMHTSVILVESTRNPGGKRAEEVAPINISVYVWGNDPPQRIATSNDDYIQIGQAIAGLVQNNGWGTSLTPVVRQSTKDLAEDKPKNEIAGAIHELVVSDGDIADDREAFKAIDILLTNVKNLTYDVMIIKVNGENTGMARVVRSLQDKHGEGRIKLVLCDDPGQAHASILLLLRERMLATKVSDAIPVRQRQKSLDKAYTAMLALR